MAPETTQDASTPQGGLTLTGQYISEKVQPGRNRPDGNGTYPDKFVVTMLVGDRTISVEYRDVNLARAAIGSPEPMQWLRVPVGVRAAQGYVFYFGR